MEAIIKGLDEHPIIRTKIPFLVNYIIRKKEHPKNVEELIQFCQALGKIIIKDIEPIRKN